MYRIATIIVMSLLAGCTVPNTELRDQPQIERLRIQISKARNAIAETRAAIAEARGAPYLSELYVRLAELLSDEARYHYQVAYEREQRAGKSLNVPQVRFLKDQAIGLYELVLREHPGTPLAPRVLFNMGQEHRELGNYDKMRAALGRLVEEHPNHTLARDGLLILGDDRFDRNELDEAAKHYTQMLTGDLNRMTGLAHYKLAWVFVNKADCKPALVHFESALITSKKWFKKAATLKQEGGGSSSMDVRREALVDSIYCFTQENRGKGAIEYLKRHAYRRGAYVAALERLADRLGTLDDAKNGAAATRELLHLAPDNAQRIDDAFMLHASLVKEKAYESVGDDVELISRAMLRQIRKPSGAQETKDKHLTDLESMVRDLATKAQDALGKLPKGSKKRAALARQVASAYDNHVRTFPDAEYTTAMLENLVDVLAESGDDFNAGRRAVEVAARLPDGATRDNAWYDALVHLQKTLAGTPGRMERVVSRAGLRKAGAALLARKLPTDRARRVKFAMARTDYDEGRYRSAIDRLNAIASEYPKTKEGNTSVHLVLDSYRTLNDYLGMIRAGYRFLSKESPVDPGIKSEIGPIVRSAEQHQLDELALAAAGVDGGDVTGDLEKFAAQYKGRALGERAIINALLAARAAGDSASVYRLADEVEKKYPKSKQLPAIRSTIARTAASRFELDQAVEFFEKAAQASASRKVPLLVANGQLQEQLADKSGALNSFSRALKAADTAAAKDQAAGPLGALLERKGDPKLVVKTLQPLADDAGPEVLAYLGLAMVRAGDRDNGEAMLQRVVDNSGGASPDARARAFYGQAEVFWQILKSFDPGEDVEAVLELVTLLEVTEQAYLKAARENSPAYTAAAFGRLAYVSQQTAQRMRNMKLPAATPAATAQQIKKAFSGKAARLDRQAAEALAACAEQGWIHHIFVPAVRVCLKGEVPSSDPVSYDELKPRRSVSVAADLEAERVRLSKNPEDLGAIKALGEAFLKAGDAHSARLVFLRAAQIGGGPLEANLLGIACYKAGDYSGSLEGFARAASGGLEVGRSNLVDALKALGLAAASKEAKKRFKTGRDGGQRFTPGGR